MADGINISVDVKEVQEALKGTALSLERIQKKTIAVINKGVLKAIKSAYRSTLKPKNAIRYERTGALYKALKSSNNGETGNVFPRALSNGRNWAMGIACILNYGAKNGKQPRGFIQKGELYAQNGSYMAEVEKMVDKELDKYWG